MARTDTLGHFLTDVADAIREKKGSNETIQASNFDTEIENLPSGGDLSEYFDTTIDSNSYRAKDYLKKTPPFVVTSDVTSLYRVFMQFPSMPSEITVTGDVSNVANVNQMFYQMEQGRKVILKNLDFSNLTSLNLMFYQNTMNKYGPSEIELDIITSNKLTSMDSLFYNCSYLSQIKGLENINVENCASFGNVFYNCRSLTTIDLSSWHPPEYLQGFSSMFQGCSQLMFLDVRNFEFSKNVSGSTGFAFSSVPAGCEIIVKNNTEKQWFATNWSNLTNVKTVEEYEAE